MGRIEVVILEAGQLEQRGYHESGHATLAHVLGVPIKSADLSAVITTPRPGCPRRVRGLVALGGPAAEDAYRGYTLEAQHELWSTVWSVDLANAMRHLAGAAMAPALDQARQLVRQHWSSIERVAQALTSRGKLTGADINALLGRGP